MYCFRTVFSLRAALSMDTGCIGDVFERGYCTLANCTVSVQAIVCLYLSKANNIRVHCLSSPLCTSVIPSPVSVPRYPLGLYSSRTEAWRGLAENSKHQQGLMLELDASRVVKNNCKWYRLSLLALTASGILVCLCLTTVSFSAFFFLNRRSVCVSLHMYSFFLRNYVSVSTPQYKCAVSIQSALSRPGCYLYYSVGVQLCARMMRRYPSLHI